MECGYYVYFDHWQNEYPAKYSQALSLPLEAEYFDYRKHHSKSMLSPYST